MLVLIQSQITQGTVIAILTASTLLVIGLLVLIGIVAWRTEQLMEFGNLFVVTVGIMTALIGFLVAFPLLVSDVFTEQTQVLALLSALFGTIVGLVGTYFGVKSSSDAREGAQQLASGVATPPTVSSISPQDRATNVPPDTRVTATFSNDMDDASINTDTFKLVEVAALTSVVGTVEYDAPTRVATFIPSTDLKNGSTYRATITTGVKDKAGNTLVQSFTWHFTVIS